MKNKKLFITKDFKNLANKTGVKGFFYLLRSLPSFLISVYRSGKSSELLSFIIWEICVNLNIGAKPILFENNNFLSLNNEHLSDYQIQQELDILLGKFKFSIIRTQEFKMIFLLNKNEGWGCLKSENNVLLHLNLEDDKYQILSKYSFPNEIRSIFVNSKGYVFICISGKILRSSDNGETFIHVLNLTNSICIFRFHCGITELPNGTLLLGEYGSLWNSSGWDSCANLYYSFNGGKKWIKTDFLIKQGVNKHVHIVKYFRNIDKLILTDGDNKKQIWIKDTKLGFSKNNNDGWKLLTKYHLQMGGHLSAIESGDEAIIGTDYYGGTNFIIRTADFVNFKKRYIPNPYRRGAISSLQKTGSYVWAITYPPEFNSCKGLLMMMKKNSNHWIRVIEFDKRYWNVEIISNSNRSPNDIMVSISKSNSIHDSIFRFKTSLN